MNIFISDTNYSQVAELKSALADLGLDTKGLKAELVDRLKAAASNGSMAAARNGAKASVPEYDPNEPTDDIDPDIPLEVSDHQSDFSSIWSFGWSKSGADISFGAMDPN